MKTNILAMAILMGLLSACGSKDEGSDNRAAVGNTSNTAVSSISATMDQLRQHFASASLASNSKAGAAYQINTFNGTIEFTAHANNATSYKINLNSFGYTFKKIISSNSEQIVFKEGTDFDSIDIYPETILVRNEQSLIAKALAKEDGKTFRVYKSKMYINGTTQDVNVVEKRSGDTILVRHVISQNESYLVNPVCTYNAQTNFATLVSSQNGATSCSANVFSNMTFLSEESEESEEL